MCKIYTVCNAVFTRSNCKNSIFGYFFYTPSGCNDCGKYEVCTKVDSTNSWKASYNNYNILSSCSSSEVWNVGDWAHHQVSLLLVLSHCSWNFNSVGSNGPSQKLPSFETSTSLDETLTKIVGVQSWPPLKLQQLVEMSTKTVRVQSCRAGPPSWRRPPLGYAQGGGYSHIRTFLFPFQQDGVLWELNMYITNFSKIEPPAEVGWQLVNRLDVKIVNKTKLG